MLKSDKTLEKMAKPFWNKACEIYPKMKSFEMPVIRFDGRVTKMLAYNYDWLNVIKISRSQYPGNEAIYKTDIIGHEIAHQVVYNLYGDTEEDHGTEWIEVMLSLGLNPSVTYEVN